MEKPNNCARKLFVNSIYTFIKCNIKGQRTASSFLVNFNSSPSINLMHLSMHHNEEDGENNRDSIYEYYKTS